MYKAQWMKLSAVLAGTSSIFRDNTCLGEDEKSGSKTPKISNGLVTNNPRGSDVKAVESHNRWNLGM
jgi:hypothetical protein